MEYEEAVDLVPFEPSPARARVLAAHADALVRIGQPAEARRQAESAVAIAAAVDAPFDEGHARHMLGLALGAEGHFDEGIEELHRARVLAEQNGDVADVAGTYVHLWRALAEQGRADEMVRLAIDAAEFCTAAGMGVAGLLLDCLAAGFLHQLGRWDEAEARLARRRPGRLGGARGGGPRAAGHPRQRAGRAGRRPPSTSRRRGDSAPRSPTGASTGCSSGAWWRWPCGRAGRSTPPSWPPKASP